MSAPSKLKGPEGSRYGSGLSGILHERRLNPTIPGFGVGERPCSKFLSWPSLQQVLICIFGRFFLEERNFWLVPVAVRWHSCLAAWELWVP